MLKWGGLVFGIGIVLVILDIIMAKRKKEGITASDKQRIAGLFWLSCVAALLVMGLIWLFPDE
jgi:hypothetical protein